MFRKNSVFFQIISIFTPHLRQFFAAIGRSEIGQPIDETVHSHCVENFKDLMQKYVHMCGVKTIFPEYPVAD